MIEIHLLEQLVAFADCGTLYLYPFIFIIYGMDSSSPPSCCATYRLFPVPVK